MIVTFFLAALEHTFYLAPTDLGLTTEELLEAGKRHWFREGELTDALGPLRYRAGFANGRHLPKADLGTPVPSQDEPKRARARAAYEKLAAAAPSRD